MIISKFGLDSRDGVQETLGEALARVFGKKLERIGRPFSVMQCSP